MDVPITKRGWRPGFQCEAADATTGVEVLTNGLWNRNRVGDKSVRCSSNRIEIEQPGERYKSAEADGSVGARCQERTWIQSANDKIIPLGVGYFIRWSGSSELRCRGAQLLIAGLVSSWRVIGNRTGTNTRSVVIGSLVNIGGQRSAIRP